MVRIIKGIHKGKKAIISETKTEFGEKLITLIDIDGKKIWNGKFTWFPESFIEK